MQRSYLQGLTVHLQQVHKSLNRLVVVVVVVAAAGEPVLARRRNRRTMSAEYQDESCFKL